MNDNINAKKKTSLQLHTFNSAMLPCGKLCQYSEEAGWSCTSFGPELRSGSWLSEESVELMEWLVIKLWNSGCVSFGEPKFWGMSSQCLILPQMLEKKKKVIQSRLSAKAYKTLLINNSGRCSAHSVTHCFPLRSKLHNMHGLFGGVKLMVQTRQRASWKAERLLWLHRAD